MADVHETLNSSKCTLSTFFEDLTGQLTLLTELVPYADKGLTLEDVRRPMLVIGKPGIGKTCGIISIVKKLNEMLPAEKKLGFKKILLGQTIVGSLTGIPVVMPDGSVKRVQMPDLPDPKKDGEYGVLFLDEITTADEMQIQPALGLTDDSRSLGEYKLPEHWVVVAAGNGPDCSNFVRLDDMTASRFAIYDIMYDYRQDWRAYAHESGVHEDIIAFLNFSPDTCVRVESTDNDIAGKLFPCPRTWTRLSTEMKVRSVLSREVTADEMSGFAGRIIGVKAAREFSAFLSFKKTLNYSPKKIIEGTEKDPEVGLRQEHFHILLQGIIKALVQEAKTDGIIYQEDGVYKMDATKPLSMEVINVFVNALRWILKVNELDAKLTAIVEFKSDIPLFSRLLSDNRFNTACPEVDIFFADNCQLIATHRNEIKNLKF